MIRSRCGPTFDRTTPRIWAWNSSMAVPLNTVRPTPVMPGCTSEIGMYRVDAGAGTRENGPGKDEHGELAEIHLSPL